MKLLHLLNEGLSSIMYHFTYVSNLAEILKNDKIGLSTTLGSDADKMINRGKFNFLSLTRSKMTGFKKGDVKIVFDGDKLNQNFKSIPIDYWQFSKNEKDWSSKSKYIESLKNIEQEDRIISDKTEIVNISKYIKEIHIWERWYKHTAIAVHYAKQRNIPVYLYDNEKDFLLQKNPIKNLDYLENPELNYESWDMRFNYDLAAFIAFNNENAYNKIVEYLNNDDKIEQFIKTLKNRTQNNFQINATYIDDGLLSIKADIHNMRNNLSSRDNNFLLNLLIRDMRKHKTNNIKEYLTAKQFIGKKTITQIKSELINYIYNYIDSYLPEEIEYRLREWVEIDGEYYNHAYESPQVINFLNMYVNVLKNFIKTEIQNEKSNDLHRIYSLNSDNLKDYINLKQIKHDLNITDDNEFINIDEKIKDILYNLTYVISYEYREKSQSLMKEYYAQFRD